MHATHHGHHDEGVSTKTNHDGRTVGLVGDGPARMAPGEELCTTSETRGRTAALAAWAMTGSNAFSLPSRAYSRQTSPKHSLLGRPRLSP